MRVISLFFFLLSSLVLLGQKEFELYFNIEVKSHSWDYFTRFNPNVGKPDITMRLYSNSGLIDTKYNEDNSCTLIFKKTFIQTGSDSLIISLYDRDEGNLNALNNDDFIGIYKVFISDTLNDFRFESTNANFTITGSVKFKTDYNVFIKTIDFQYDRYDDRTNKIRKKDLKNFELTLFKGYTLLHKVMLEKNNIQGFKINLNKSFLISGYYNDEFILRLKNNITLREIEFIFKLDLNEFKILRKNPYSVSKIIDIKLLKV